MRKRQGPDLGLGSHRDVAGPPHRIHGVLGGGSVACGISDLRSEGDLRDTRPERPGA
jgi:hypothetical protein